MTYHSQNMPSSSINLLVSHIQILLSLRSRILLTSDFCVFRVHFKSSVRYKLTFYGFVKKKKLISTSHTLNSQKQINRRKRRQHSIEYRSQISTETKNSIQISSSTIFMCVQFIYIQTHQERIMSSLIVSYIIFLSSYGCISRWWYAVSLRNNSHVSCKVILFNLKTFKPTDELIVELGEKKKIVVENLVFEHLLLCLINN